MARIISRTGCATCKARKIKCDEQKPCGQCARGKRKCPGPITEPIFVIATEQPEDFTKSTPSSRKVPSKAPHRAKSANLNRNLVPLRINNHLSPQVDVVQSNQAQLFHLFIQDFATLHVDPADPPSWLLQVPFESTPPGLEQLFTTATSSTTMAFFGMITANKTLKEEARRCYVAGLTHQRRELLHLHRKTQGWDERRRTHYTKCLTIISMLLCGYELLLPSAPNVWFLHVEGAAFLLERLGPKACQDDIIHKIFYILRYGVVLTSFVTPKSIFLSSEAWLQIPFENRAKTPFDELVNILLTVPWTEIEPGISMKLSESDRQDRVSMIQAAMRQLTDWWCQFHNRFNINYAPAEDFIAFGPRYHKIYKIGIVVVTLHNGALVKLLGILRQISPQTVDELQLHDKHWQHSERVLSAAEYAGTIDNIHSRLQVTPPTIVVATYGATPDQMKRAQNILDGFAADNEKGQPHTVSKAVEVVTS